MIDCTLTRNEFYDNRDFSTAVSYSRARQLSLGWRYKMYLCLAFLSCHN